MNLRPLSRTLVTAAIACVAPSLHGCGSDSPTGPETLPQTLATVQAGVDLITTGRIPIVGTCAGTTPVNCPSGTLASPVYLNLTRSAVAVALVPGTDRYDFSATLAAATATGIPITLPNIGACTLNIDTAPGTSPTAVLTGSVRFASQTLNGPIDRLDFSNLAASGLENADVSITGGIGCTVANLVTTILVAQIASILTQVPSLCAAPGPALLRPCPPEPAASARRL